MTVARPGIPSLPYDLRAVEDALTAYVVTGTALNADRVEWLRGNAPLTDWPCARLQWISDTTLGWPSYSNEALDPDPGAPSPNIVQRTSLLSVLVLQIDVYSLGMDPEGGARARALACRASTFRRDTLAPLQAVGLGVSDVGAVTDADGPIGGDATLRHCMFEITAYITQTSQVLIPSIDTIDVTGDVNGVATLSFTVPQE